MDNYNNQYQENQQVYNQQQYAPYVNGGQQYNAYAYGQYGYGNPVPQPTMEAPVKKSFITISLILGLLGSVLLFVGLMMPIIDFSHFHKDVDIQYNLFKVGKNVGIISGMWNVIPYAILISIILLVALSFVRIPIFKILPVILILCMFVLMLVDMGNVAAWASDMLDKLGIVLEKDITTGEIFKSLMPGMYIMVGGTLISFGSCFVKIRE